MEDLDTAGQHALVAPAGGNKRSVRSHQLRVALCASALSCGLLLFAITGSPHERNLLQSANTGIVQDLGQAPNYQLTPQSMQQKIMNNFEADTHKVYVNNIKYAETMAEKRETFAVPCSWGVHCHLHVPPTLRERTRGAWLGEGVVGSAPSVAVRASAGPWNLDDNDDPQALPVVTSTSLPSTNFAVSQSKLGGSSLDVEKDDLAMKALADSEAAIKKQMADSLSSYVSAGAKA